MERRAMKTATRKIPRFSNYANVPETYRELCQLYLPRPIGDDREDAAATEMMNALAVFPQLNAEQRDYLDVLTEFVDAYDKSKPVRWPRIKGRDVRKHPMAENGMNGV